MKIKAWSLVGGLITLGTLCDNLTRPAFAQGVDDKILFLQDHLENETNSTSKFFEFDVGIRPANNVNRLLSLYANEEPSDDGIEQELNGHKGYLEKNLSDFFDIQIFSTVYFGSRHEPH